MAQFGFGLDINKTADKFLLLDGEGNISKTLNCEDIFLKNVVLVE